MIPTIPPADSADNGGVSPEAMLGQEGQGAATASSPQSRSGSPSAKMSSPGFMERVQARVRPDEQYRDEIVRSIFGEVGTPVEDFSCAVVSRILLHGRMYVTSSFVCFYSNLFGFEKIVKIPFCHMRCITKEKTALFIPNAIAIITSRKEYIFRSFWDREDAFRTLKMCHQASLRQGSAGEPSPGKELSPKVSSHFGPGAADRERGANEFQRHIRHSSSGRMEADENGVQDLGKPQLKRRLLWSAKDRSRPSVTGEGGGEERRPRSYSGASFADSSDSSSASLVSHPDVENRERQDKQGSQTAGPPSESAGGAAKEERGDGDRPEANGQEKETKSGAVGDGGAQVGLKVGASDDGGDSEVDVLGVEGSPVNAVNLGATTGGGTPHTKGEEFKLALQAFREGWPLGDEGGVKPPEGSHGNGATVRLAADLPCQLQVFFQTFIANDAEKGLVAFHESIGDTEVRSTPWKVSGGAMGMTREIRFVHPVKAPIGPNRTRAVKLQRCRTYGDHGLILETSTHLEDIMMSDYFQIEDRFVARPGHEGSIRIDVEVEIKFFKSTMLRKAIETKSLTETRGVWELFVDMARESLSTRAANRLLPDSGQDSDDEDRMRRTRERLRERRKHRNRHRHLSHPHPHSHPHPPPPHHHPPSHHHDRHRSPPDASREATDDSGACRPRAKSAAPRLTTGPPGAGAENGRGRTGGGRKSKGAPDVGVSVRATPSDGLQSWLASAATVPWVLLGMIFLWEGLQFVRFKSETVGFLEASEAALLALGDGIVARDDVGGAGEVLVGMALKEELALRLVKIYARNRFMWPFSSFFG